MSRENYIFFIFFLVYQKMVILKVSKRIKQNAIYKAGGGGGTWTHVRELHSRSFYKLSHFYLALLAAKRRNGRRFNSQPDLNLDDYPQAEVIITVRLSPRPLSDCGQVGSANGYLKIRQQLQQERMQLNLAPPWLTRTVTTSACYSGSSHSRRIQFAP